MKFSESVFASSATESPQMYKEMEQAGFRPTKVRSHFSVQADFQPFIAAFAFFAGAFLTRVIAF
jgi:hypothetical protein